MRVGVSSRGNAWMSMGPLGWLILGPFIVAGYAVWFGAVVVCWLVTATVRGIAALCERKD